MRTPFLVFLGCLAACGGSSSAGPPLTGVTPIADVQGPGSVSPLVDRDVTVEGTVIGDFQDGDDDNDRNLGGFFVQGAGDDDPATSDGIFVFQRDSLATDVAPGDRVRVTGTVVEHFGETQLAATDIVVTGSGAVQPTSIALPVMAVRNSDGELIADLEKYEGMLVTFPQALTVSQLRNLERFGEVLLGEGGRQFAFTNLNVPDIAGFTAHLNDVASRRIYLDDGLRTDNSGTLLPIRNGDTVTGLTGVLRFSRGSGESGTEAYRLMPTVEPAFTSANPRPGPPVVDGSLRIATFNADNYFSTIDDGRQICGPQRDANCRGANSAEEHVRQLAKIVTVLRLMDAHIVAMIEIENNDNASLRTIVDALNAAVGAARFDFVHTGTIGDDAIRVGLIYQPAHVRPSGDFAVLGNDVDSRFDERLHRPVLAQTFDTVSGNHRFTVAANHLKSKGSSCASSGDPDVGDGQGNCSASRALAASAMVAWLARDPTGSDSGHVLVIGDFNTHTRGDALARFETAGYVNLAGEFIGADAYSFEFDGQFGSLDHAMASPELAQKVVDVVEWRINADESRAHDYNLEFGRDPTIFKASSPYRASDHDPLIVGIEF